MVPSLTVFTPTYNRAHTLHLCYESLIRQSCKDFVWLIIDDGSTDRTRELVEGWISEGRIVIRYHYQDNQGMHGAHNAAYERMDTELNVCIDSDDYLADNAVERILSFWRRHGSEQYAGIVGLDASPDGEIIGSAMPEGLKASTLSGLYAKWKVKGDKKLVYRTAVTSGVPPYPIFPGEKYVPLTYKYLLIDQQLPLLVMNEVLCHVEYRADGSSLNMIRQYRNNPQGFAFFRKVAMVYAPSFKERLREAVHYVSSSLIMGNRRFVAESPRKASTVLALPLGVLLYLYIRRTQRPGPVIVQEMTGRIRPVQESDSQ
ncbi:glycosyltransferase involved in cell wall biosynthesis [Paenibacillus forsythiae]|uniref:Glycosyltransferase involved in cell wall biosynthesis n=1 Tax=Paenibacillus forsythiae TaxID=365616 RepID=A0ABU3HDC2_9BACL|nr:glycosyltransferase family A protein [Paenibacillus forsythiae]MDT3428809.1 glycosyltransferase involved in cell wall biosynthesis [Paenibacillus forsythiae]